MPLVMIGREYSLNRMVTTASEIYQRYMHTVQRYRKKAIAFSPRTNSSVRYFIAGSVFVVVVVVVVAVAIKTKFSRYFFFARKKVYLYDANDIYSTFVELYGRTYTHAYVYVFSVCICLLLFFFDFGVSLYIFVYRHSYNCRVSSLEFAR